MTLSIDKQKLMHEVVAPWSPRLLGLLRAASSLVMPGQATGIVCSLAILAAVIQTGSYSVLMPESVLTLFQRAASLTKQKGRPPSGGLPEFDICGATQ